jgi:hypothetical protein
VTVNIVDQTDEKIATLAEPLLQNMLDGAHELHYAKFSRDFSHGMKMIMPEDLFMEQTIGINQVRGRCTTRKLLGILRKHKTALALWSARYDKTPDDMLIELKLTYEHDKLVITGAAIV